MTANPLGGRHVAMLAALSMFGDAPAVGIGKSRSTRRRRRQRSHRRRAQSVAERLKWERDALGQATLAKDLHPHVRRREMARRKSAK